MTYRAKWIVLLAVQATVLVGVGIWGRQRQSMEPRAWVRVFPEASGDGSPTSVFGVEVNVMESEITPWDHKARVALEVHQGRLRAHFLDRPLAQGKFPVPLGSNASVLEANGTQPRRVRLDTLLTFTESKDAPGLNPLNAGQEWWGEVALTSRGTLRPIALTRQAPRIPSGASEPPPTR